MRSLEKARGGRGSGRLEKGILPQKNGPGSGDFRGRGKKEATLKGFIPRLPSAENKRPLEERKPEVPESPKKKIFRLEKEISLLRMRKRGGGTRRGPNVIK